MSWAKAIHKGVKGFEPYGVILAVIGLLLTLLTYAAETNDRQSERIFKAWEIVNSEMNVGSSKRRAMEYLNMAWEGSLCGPPFSRMLRWVSPDPKQNCIFPSKGREDLAGINVSKAQLQYVDLNGAYLSAANISAANLRDANLGYADLTDATLWGADLESANLYKANLTRANLRDAKLLGSNLSGSDLRGADFRSVDISGANLGLDASLLPTKVGQEQIDQACQSPNRSAPKLPAGLTWHGRICERYKKKPN